MKTILLTVLTSALTTLAIVWGVYNYASIPVGELKFGSTIVNITGTDKLKDFPAAYNATVNSLNATKLEISDFAATTSMPNLAGIGTITSGTWNATAIAVNRGGTGLTSYTAGDILYATGATTLAKLGAGADGQLLTLSSGVPAWGSPSIDTTLDYSWTGHHIFTSLFTTRASTTHATTTTLSVNGLNYRFPSAHGASSTVLTQDGGGGLTWQGAGWDLLLSTTTNVAMQVATSSFPSRSNLRVMFQSASTTATCEYEVRFNGDVSSRYANRSFFNEIQTTFVNSYFVLMNTQPTTSPVFLDFNISNASSTLPKYVTYSGVAGIGSQIPAILRGVGSYSGDSVVSSVTFSCIGAGGGSFLPGTNIRVYGSRD
jgi:hypothetical protein